jgi:ribosomal protein L40E
MNQKFCPKCGTANRITDSYCLRCGYAFLRRKKKENLRKIIILLILLIGGWIIYSTITKQPIIPPGILNLFQNQSYNTTG